MLMAQAELENLPIVTYDTAFHTGLIQVIPASTIVATGTGSGKTECFLLPLLEHCRQQAGNRGIETILIYPMNALATDRAKRIAEPIDRTPSLKFHTFDGAQGTDLACLLRRLKHRLQTPKNHLACVGTSATLGNSDSKQEMLTYASQIFQETFDELAVIEEARLSAGEFLADALLNVLPVPHP